MGVGQKISAENAGWSFGGDVPDFFVKNDSVCYETGTSTGELMCKPAEHNAGKPGAKWIGFDVEPAMVKAARAHCAGLANVSISHEDASIAEIEKSDLIVSYYTMQFVPPRYRQELFDSIYESLNWGGAFLMLEKVRGLGARLQDMLSKLYNDFKIRNGYSGEEIVEKNRSPKGILKPFSTQGKLDLMARAGFRDVATIQKYLCFEGFLAIK